MSSISSISDHEIPEGQEQQQTEEQRAQKRTRESSGEGEWTTVGLRKDKKLKDTEKIEVYITSNEKLPKQFALASIFKEQKISDIIRVKYLNPFKVRVDFVSEISAEKLETCQTFKDMNWRIQKALERSYSYGIIKNVDLELSNESILERILCSGPAQLISANRLNRRKVNEPGWIPSETVRLCFKGTFIPAYVYVDEMRVKVDKYEFPVTQCSHCWKFGHQKNRCIFKIVCPKCGDNHENCENTQYKCTNCSGKHMAFTKVCPIYMKEKKIRFLMTEFNCTYRKALELYVPPESPYHEKEREEDISDGEDEPQQFQSTTSESREPTEGRNIPTYADMTKNKDRKKSKPTKKQTKSHSHKQYKETQPEDEDMEDLQFNDTNNIPSKCNSEGRQKKLNFGELLNKLKEIIFLRGVTIQAKIVAGVKCCIEWAINAFVNNLSDWPSLKVLLAYLQDVDGKEQK